MAAIWIMFKINTLYAVLAIALMGIIYLIINQYHRERQGIAGVFINSLFQLNRNLQVFLQKKGEKQREAEWRPSAICISSKSFERQRAFEMLNWISYKYGFGTYIHRIPGYYSHATYEQAQLDQDKLRNKFSSLHHQVYIDTLISPSYTSAIAQAIQIPGISGMENNLVLFEYNKDVSGDSAEIIDNLSLIHSGNFDITIFASSKTQINYAGGIHIWIRSSDYENANLMILLSFIILGHSDWRKSNIRIFEVYKPDALESTKQKVDTLIQTGRLPITRKNLEWIQEDPNIPFKDLVNSKSSTAGLALIGFNMDKVKHDGEKALNGFDDVPQILFVNSHKQINID